MSKLTHFDETGRAAMVDVSGKAMTSRKAIAVGQVKMALETLALVQTGDNKKGDVFSVAELAGIMGAKKQAILSRSVILCRYPRSMFVLRLMKNFRD